MKKIAAITAVLIVSMLFSVSVALADGPGRYKKGDRHQGTRHHKYTHRHYNAGKNHYQRYHHGYRHPGHKFGYHHPNNRYGHHRNPNGSGYLSYRLLHEYGMFVFNFHNNPHHHTDRYQKRKHKGPRH